MSRSKHELQDENTEIHIRIINSILPYFLDFIKSDEKNKYTGSNVLQNIIKSKQYQQIVEHNYRKLLNEEIFLKLQALVEYEIEQEKRRMKTTQIDESDKNIQYDFYQLMNFDSQIHEFSFTDIQIKNQIQNEFDQVIKKRYFDEHQQSQQQLQCNQIQENFKYILGDTQKPITKLSFEKAEIIRMNLEQILGAQQFLNIYQIFSGLRKKFSIDDIYLQYGPTFQGLIPDMNQKLFQDYLPKLFQLIEFDFEQ